MSEPRTRPSGRTPRSCLRSEALPGAIGVATQRPLTRDVDWHGSLGLNTSHCTIVVVDVEGFGRYSRTNPNKIRIRRGMYRSLERAFIEACVPWAACRHEDLGDGLLALAPAHISKALFADLLVPALADELGVHNRVHRPPEQIRLRLALHAGEVSCDDHGVVGSSIIHTHRLVDADELKATLRESEAVLAVAVSDYFFEEVVRHSERSFAHAYRPVGTTTGKAWVRLITPSRRRRAG